MLTASTARDTSYALFACVKGKVRTVSFPHGRLLIRGRVVFFVLVVFIIQFLRKLVITGTGCLPQYVASIYRDVRVVLFSFW